MSTSKNDQIRKYKRIVRRAQAWMDQHLKPYRKINETNLARAAKVSASDLRRAFHFSVGDHWKTVWESKRLAAANRELQHAKPHMTVAWIAEAYGFSNAGRFTKLYEKQYRATPLETKNQKRNEAGQARKRPPKQ